jgi:hypothetical protein
LAAKIQHFVEVKEMNMIRKVASCFFMLFATVGLSKGKDWRGITPLQSTREDVIRLLGYSDAPCGCAYDLGDETVSMNYSDGPCEKGMPGGWNVPRDTVISILVNLIARPFLADLNIDEKKYEKVIDHHVIGNIYYVDKEEGVTIGTYEGRVNWIGYTPAAKDEHLRCPNEPIAPTEKGPATYPLAELDIYGDIPFTEEKARLDMLASELRDKPDLRGYIIVYAGKRACAGEADARARSAKSYLVNERGIKANRIVAADGGYREEPGVEIWVGSRGVPAPTATPTVRPSEVQIIKDGNMKNHRCQPRPRRRSH